MLLSLPGAQHAPGCPGEARCSDKEHGGLPGLTAGAPAGLLPQQHRLRAGRWQHSRPAGPGRSGLPAAAAPCAPDGLQASAAEHRGVAEQRQAGSQAHAAAASALRAAFRHAWAVVLRTAQLLHGTVRGLRPLRSAAHAWRCS